MCLFPTPQAGNRLAALHRFTGLWPEAFWCKRCPAQSGDFDDGQGDRLWAGVIQGVAWRLIRRLGHAWLQDVHGPERQGGQLCQAAWRRPDQMRGFAQPAVATMLLSGSCHCANICLRLDWQPEPTEIPARACTCCFCTKHGGVWTSCPTASLEVVIKDPDRVSRYAFATRTALFHICSNCGVVPVVTRRVDDVLYAVVNVHALESVDRSLLRRASATFDEEDEADRLARRTRGWIGQVELIEGGS